MYIYIYLYIHVHTYFHIYTCLHIYTQIYIYIYICTNICIYIYEEGRGVINVEIGSGWMGKVSWWALGGSCRPCPVRSSFTPTVPVLFVFRLN